MTKNKEDEVKEIEKDLKKYYAIDFINTTNEGKVFKDSLSSQVASLVRLLSVNKDNHTRLIGIISDIEARLELLGALRNAKENADGAKEMLEQILKTEN